MDQGQNRKDRLMAQICGFGTAPEQKKEGFRGIGTVSGTDEDVLTQFFSDEVRLVRGGELASSPGRFEFFVMVKDEVAPLHVRIAQLEKIIGSLAPEGLSVEGRIDAGRRLIMNTEIPPETKVLLPDGRVGYMEEFRPEEAKQGEYAYSVWVLKDPLNESLGGEYFMYDRDELSRLDGKLYGVVKGDLANKPHLESLGVEVAGYSEADRAFRVSMSEAVMREVLKFGADYAVDVLFRQERAGQIPHKEMTEAQLAAETAYYDFMIAASVPYTPNSTTSESWYAAHGGFPGSPDVPPATVFMDLKSAAEELLAAMRTTSIGIITTHPPCQNFSKKPGQSDLAP